MVERIARQDVPQEQRWNSQVLFADWDALVAEMQAVKTDLPTLNPFQGKLTQNPEQVLTWFETYNALDTRLMRLYVYLHMATAVDTNDSVAKATMTKWQGLYAQFQANIAFAQPEMIEQVDTLLEWSDTVPELALYKPYFQKLKQQKAHTQSANVEQVLGMLSEPFSKPMTLWTQLANVDLHHDDIVTSEGEPAPFKKRASMTASERDIRRQTWENRAQAYLAYKNTFANNYLLSVQQNTVLARVRNYESVLQMRMESQGLPTQVYHNLINAFTDNLGTWHRYWDVKRRTLGVDALHPYDIWAPIVADPPVIAFEQAVDWISEAVRPLGDEYVATMRKGCLQDRWVDRAVNDSKEMGAFSNTSHAESMPYIMMSYDQTLHAVSTLAHELGHSMSLLAVGKAQPAIYNNYVLGLMSDAVIETPSNFHQAMTRAYLQKIKADDKQFMIALIDEAMYNFHRYFFYMPSIARFEYVVHQKVWNGDPLTADTLNDIMREIIVEGYGDTMRYNPDYAAITWAQLPHVYRPFYSFQYAVGISAAYAMATAILNEEDSAVDRYLEFARLGASRGGLESFAMGGVDMSTREAIDKAFAVLANWVDQLEAIAT